jgi:mannose-1-phosphate guanylyltransferase/mannose-6-phosphate isomerase
MVELARQSLEKATVDADFLRLDRESFAACPADSIDYAVMEKTDSAAILPIDVGWNDVGSWSALWSVVEQDGDGNAHRGDVLARDCRNTLAISDKRLVALIGLSDIVVVDTDDAVLIAHKDRVISEGDRNHAEKGYRPHDPASQGVGRGSYDGIDSGERFQQAHHHCRARR